MKKLKEENCKECLHKINLKKDKYVLLGTYNNVIKDEEIYFHFDCWIKYFNDKVMRRSKIEIDFAKQKVMKVMENPLIKSMLSQVQGSGLALNMLKTPLQTDEKAEYVSKEDVEKKIKDGKRKKQLTARKTRTRTNKR